MELRDYFKIIGKNFIVFIIIIIIGGLTAFLFTDSQPTTYTGSNTFSMNKLSSMKQSQVNYYLYENYYNFQSSSMFAQTATTWFASPTFVQEVYTRAGVSIDNLTQASLKGVFKATYTAPVTVDVSLTGSNKDEVTSLITATSDVLQVKATDYGKNSESVYDITKFTPIVSENAPSTMLNTLIGFAGGLIIALIAVVLIEYLKKESK